jgi:hypothetical protein
MWRVFAGRVTDRKAYPWHFTITQVTDNKCDACSKDASLSCGRGHIYSTNLNACLLASSPKKSPGQNKKRVELRLPTAAVDLQLWPVPCGVPTPRHHSSGQRQPPPHPGGLPIPTRPELRQSPRAMRPPRLLQLRPSRPPISAPASPARAPHLYAAPSLQPRPRRSRVVGGLQSAASSDQSMAVFVSARARFARVHRPPWAEVQHRSLLFPFPLRLCSWLCEKWIRCCHVEAFRECVTVNWQQSVVYTLLLGCRIISSVRYRYYCLSLVSIEALHKKKVSIEAPIFTRLLELTLRCRLVWMESWKRG